LPLSISYAGTGGQIAQSITSLGRDTGHGIREHGNTGTRDRHAPGNEHGYPERIQNAKLAVSSHSLTHSLTPLCCYRLDSHHNKFASIRACPTSLPCNPRLSFFFFFALSHSLSFFLSPSSPPTVEARDHIEAVAANEPGRRAGVQPPPYVHNAHTASQPRPRPRPQDKSKPRSTLHASSRT
jgi:hypothetical protein